MTPTQNFVRVRLLGDPPWKPPAGPYTIDATILSVSPHIATTALVDFILGQNAVIRYDAPMYTDGPNGERIVDAAYILAVRPDTAAVNPIVPPK